jgi:hypothetical protein
MVLIAVIAVQFFTSHYSTRLILFYLPLSSKSVFTQDRLGCNLTMKLGKITNSGKGFDARSTLQISVNILNSAEMTVLTCQPNIAVFY